MATIILPKNTLDIIELAVKIVDTAEGGENAQLWLVQTSVADLKKQLQDALPLFEELRSLRVRTSDLNSRLIQIAGSHNQFRKITPGTMRFSIAQIRDLLKGHYREDQIRLRKWGFTVHTNEDETNP